MRIGEVAERAGVGVETIRFYERKGLVERPPKPGGSGYRRYPPAAVDRVRCIRQAQRLGFSLREIDELLRLRADPDAACADVRERAEAKLDEVDDRIARLMAIRSALDDLVRTCRGRGPVRQGCPILDALDAGETSEEETIP